MNEGLVIGLPVGNFVLLLCHDVVCIIRIMRDLILPLGKSSIYSTKPPLNEPARSRHPVDVRGGTRHT